MKVKEKNIKRLEKFIVKMKKEDKKPKNNKKK